MIQEFLKGKLAPIGLLQTAKNQHIPEIQMAENPHQAAQVENEIRSLMLENTILGSLAFSVVRDCRDSVEIAYSRTFEWIYGESHTSEKSWGNFVDWLRHGNGIYWINGKLGSGKSTLMRYIYENTKTREELKVWTRPLPLEMSGFLLWNSGDLEQRSQSCLLRSVLLEILQRHQNLLPEILPDD